MGNQLVDLLLAVDDAEHDGRILGKLPVADVTNPAACPIAFDAPVDDRSGQPQLHAFGEDRLIKRLALPPVSLAEMDAQHTG